MSFNDEFNKIKNILHLKCDIEIESSNYDAFIVKNMSATNCISKNINSHQSHIAITGQQMNLFPYIYQKGFIEDKNKDLKNFFVFKAPVYIYKNNCDYLGSNNIDFQTLKRKKVEMCIYPRAGGEQIQLSIKNKDSKDFILFRELIDVHDNLIVLKYKDKLLYDAFAIKHSDGQEVFSSKSIYEFSQNSNTFINETQLMEDVNGYNINKNLSTKNLYSDTTCNPIDHNIQALYFGAPGTGKSFAVSKLIKSIYPDILEKDNPFIFKTTVYADYSYYNFVGSIMPKKDENGEIGYDFKAGIFTQALVKALKHKDKEIFLIVEEMSRTDIASVFGDIFQLLDRDENGESEYSINNELISHFLEEQGLGNSKVSLPSNFHILGTVNTSDQNVNVIDTAFKRRFDFLYTTVDPIKDKTDTYYNSYTFTFKNDTREYEWNRLYVGLNKFITEMLELSEDKQIGQFFIKFKNYKTDEQRYKAIQNKLLHYLWEDVQNAAMTDEHHIFDYLKYKTFSKLYKDFENNENIFSKEFLNVYDNIKL